jgi:hypothetical protein
MNWLSADPSDYQETDTDEAKILRDIAVPCRICESAFRRLRMTLRYCATCHHGFCEGEHGSFAGAGRARCLFCGPRP